MILYAESKEAPFYKVIDLNTNLEIKHCLFANDETGEYEVYVCDKKGNLNYFGEDYQTKKQKGNIKLVKKGAINV